MLHSVNFYGHAVVASWFRTEPPFVLGAMLPDFLSMLGRARPNLTLPSSATELAAGLALHRATDAAFHDLPGFVELVSRARAALSRAKLPRGAARAIAHIGVEMLLDEELTSDAEARSAYVRALDYSRDAELPLAWTSGEELRFQEMMRALAGRGVPETLVPPLDVARRLRRVLATHPRLAFEVDSEGAVGNWVAETRPAVGVNAPAILNELRARLYHRTTHIDGVHAVGQ